MTAGQIVGLLLAAVLMVVGVLAYRRGGTQGGVILIFIALICGVYGFGLMEYRPSAAELEQL